MPELDGVETGVIRNILIVDDEPNILMCLQAFLEDSGYQIATANNGQEALDAITANPPDMLILDLNMPKMSGHELLKHTSASFPDMPKLVLSGIGDIAVAMQTIHEGAWDFLSKPIYDMKILSHKISMLEENARLVRENRLHRENLERLVEQKTTEMQQLSQEIIDTQKEIVAKLGDVIETRSNETGNHVRRVAHISSLLAVKYGFDPIEAETLRMASPLHDVGKVGIPDGILNKPGKLTDAEFEQIKTHTTIGYNMLKESKQPIIQAAAIISLQHHEYWNGGGYPQGLQGEDIHIYGRITAIADVYDALRQKREYKESWSQEKTLEFIKKNSGVMFDPKLVELFLQSIPELEEILRHEGPHPTGNM